MIGTPWVRADEPFGVSVDLLSFSEVFLCCCFWCRWGSRDGLESEPFTSELLLSAPCWIVVVHINVVNARSTVGLLLSGV